MNLMGFGLATNLQVSRRLLVSLGIMRWKSMGSYFKLQRYEYLLKDYELIFFEPLDKLVRTSSLLRRVGLPGSKNEWERSRRVE